MPRLSPELRERALRLRDELLDAVEDKQNPRYLALMEEIAEGEERRKVGMPSGRAKHSAGHAEVWYALPISYPLPMSFAGHTVRWLRPGGLDPLDIEGEVPRSLIPPER